MRDSNEIMPALVFKYENAQFGLLITHTIELKYFEITAARARNMAGLD